MPECRPPREEIEATGILDLGERGQVLGIEVAPLPGLDVRRTLHRWRKEITGAGHAGEGDGDVYLQLSTDESARAARLARSVPVRLRLTLDERGEVVAVTFPRRGDDYELSYPSGST